MFMRFNSNGAIQIEMAVAGGGGGSGSERCQGAYQFNGQMLAVRWSACQSCGAARCYPNGNSLIARVYRSPYAGRFIDDYTVNIGGEVYHRQQ